MVGLVAHMAGQAVAWRGRGGPIVEQAIWELALRLVAYTLARRAWPDLPSVASGPATLLTAWTGLPEVAAWPAGLDCAWVLDDARLYQQWEQLVVAVEALPASVLASGLAALAAHTAPPARDRGAFATPAEVADLLAGWAVRDGREAVLDPACGAGMLLARVALQRAWLGGEAAAPLWGVECEAGTAALARLALAGLGAAGARVSVADFLAPVPALPNLVDAVVANPPFVRHERANGPAAGGEFRGRADLHAHFWPALTARLVDGGRAALVTPASWLEADYGVAVQRYLLDHYVLAAIIEPAGERWFAAAGVHTVLVLARRCTDAAERAASATRLVRLRRPLAALLGSDGAGRPVAAAALVERLEALTTDEEGLDWRVRLVPAARLAAGCRPPTARRWPATRGDAGRRIAPAEAHSPTRADQPVALPWGSWLRAPEVLVQLLADRPARWRRLGDLARPRYPLKTGADDFFYLTAVEAAARRLEPEYLRPVVRTPRELTGLTVEPAGLRWRVLALPPLPADALPPGVRRYLVEGEAAGLHRRPTCAARRPWYALPLPPSAPLLWPRFVDGRHAVWRNTANALENQTLYGLLTPADLVPVLTALLNSSLVALIAEVYGRYGLGEGALQFSVGQLATLPIPDLRGADAALLDELGAVGEALAGYAHPDGNGWQKAADSLVLRALGASDYNVRTDLGLRIRESRLLLVRDRQQRARGMRGLPDQYWAAAVCSQPDP